MDRVSLPLLSFSKRVMAHEMAANGLPAAASSSSAASFEKLRAQVVTLTGDGGFRALLARALALAQNDVVWLRGAHVSAEGILEGLAPADRPHDPDQLAEGNCVVLAHFFELLVTFIGTGLTVKMVREVWPEISPDESEFIIGESFHGQTK